jgi:hypothetical protein
MVSFSKILKTLSLGPRNAVIAKLLLDQKSQQSGGFALGGACKAANVVY